jgi:hypothetical protein
MIRLRPLTGQAGQATVEVVAFLPLLVTVAFALFSVLAAAAAREQAGHAAEAAAVALLQERDPAAAAKAAVPPGTAKRLRVARDGRRITVRVRPALPVAAVDRLLTAEAVADAGPEPSP